ncbi:MAG TPA: cytochrome c3 family protein [Aromatoleum sp.]|uniref:cytochrome c3 family protein n=1 Tax=Aromatoleum sp. TaxID=2307007 RepID=UPI002B47AA7B|nr:cytochrome c3 family protein [Aromatoleum sp.]HJV26148.1 cytochrome c3 family protein [Aromatoleum sp.]
MQKKKLAAIMAVVGLVSSGMALSGTDLPTKFSNQGTIGNTRHNLTQRQASGGGPNGGVMDPYRNDYQQVCVYCHTPHAANQSGQIAAAPLWNRTFRTPSYTLYNQQTLTGTATQPGPNSLTCLSCHDGQTAVDSIVNMPGSGGYNAGLALDPSSATADSLLNTWRSPSGSHMGLKDGECLACHSSGAGALGATATDFTVFAIGTDLTNDHPVGVQFPTGADWNSTAVTKGKIKFFDLNGNGRPDKNELRFYDSGQGFEVECASCHDPHGVQGAGATFLPTFLRVTPEGSAICLTCHVK